MSESEEETEDDFRSMIFKTIITLSQVIAFVYLILNVDLVLARNVIAIAFVPPLVSIILILGYSYFFD